RKRRIHHANEEASGWLTAGDGLNAGGDILTLRDSPAQKWVADAVLRLAHDEKVPTPAFVVRSGKKIVRVSTSRISFNPPPGGASPPERWSGGEVGNRGVWRQEDGAPVDEPQSVQPAGGRRVIAASATADAGYCPHAAGRRCPARASRAAIRIRPVRRRTAAV